VEKRTGSVANRKRVPNAQRVCKIDGCDKRVLARGWCRTHYTRWYERGTTELRGLAGRRRRPVKPLEERFWAKVQRTDGCWIWQGGKSKLGYGSIWGGPGNPRHLMAHRVSWELVNGPIPDGLHIDHLCRNPSCVNPAHLEPVTRSVNAQRGLCGPLGAADRAKRQRTHCPQGHIYDEANTYVSETGARMCRTCIRTRMAARRKAQREGVPYADPFLRL
jgi:hypothetical protein